VVERRLVGAVRRPIEAGKEDRSKVHTRFPVPGHQGACLAGWPVESTDPDGIDRAVLTDLRRAAGRYPADRRLGSLIQRTIDGNATFARLWSEGAVGAHREEHKTIRHPHAGDITVTCDVLNDGDTDLKVVAYTTTPGSEDEARLAFTRVVGSAAGLWRHGEVPDVDRTESNVLKAPGKTIDRGGKKGVRHRLRPTRKRPGASRCITP
jgi:hypothetical protein